MYIFNFYCVGYARIKATIAEMKVTKVFDDNIYIFNYYVGYARIKATIAEMKVYFIYYSCITKSYTRSCVKKFLRIIPVFLFIIMLGMPG